MKNEAIFQEIMTSIHKNGLKSCVSEVSKTIANRRFDCRVVTCVNPHSVAVAMNDHLFFSAIKNSTWILADGIGIVTAAKLQGAKNVARVTGPDFYISLLRDLDKTNGSVFFLGAEWTTLSNIENRLKKEFPNVIFAGGISPPFKPKFDPQESESWVAQINDAKPDVLFVGMTAPKQEKWVEEHRLLLKVNCACSIGAAFDFFANTTSRSPKMIRNLGLEWLYRLLLSPKKMWRRTFVSLPKFIFIFFKHILTRPY